MLVVQGRLTAKITALVFCLGAAWFTLAFAVQCRAAGAWLIKVKEAAVIQGEKVVLKEIAEPLSALPEQQWERIRETTLWTAPSDREGVMTIPRRKIYSLLTYYLDDLARATVIPSSLRLQKGGKVLLPETLQRKVVRELKPKARVLGSDIEFREFRLPGYIFLQRPSQEVRIVNRRPLEPGRNALLLIVTDGPKDMVRKISGSVFLDVWKTVPCAARPLNRGDRIGPQAVTHKRKNLAYLKDKVWDGRGLAWQVRRPVGEGQVIYASNLEIPPLIEKGEKVMLVFTGQHIELKVPAEALEDGGAGEVIPVINLQSNTKVQARVKDKSTVTVQ